MNTTIPTGPEYDRPELVAADEIVYSSGKWVVIPAADLPKVRQMNRHERRAYTAQLKRTDSRPGVAPAPTAKDHLKKFQKAINQLGADRTELIVENSVLRTKLLELLKPDQVLTTSEIMTQEATPE